MAKSGSTERILARGEGPDKDGEWAVLERKTSPKLYYKFKMPDGSWSKKKSTKTTNKEQAKKVAERKWTLFHEAAKDGVKLPELAPKTSFRALANEVNRNLDMGIRKGHINPKQRNYITYNRKYHIPYFGTTPIDKIGPKMLEGLNDFRNEVWLSDPKTQKKVEGKEDKRLAASTIGSMNAALSKVFELAARREYIPEWKIPKLEKKGRDQEPGATFEVDEVDQLLTFLEKPDGWVDDPTIKQRSRDMRHILRDVIYLLCETGIRAGESELYDMRWKQLSTYIDPYDDKERINIRIIKSKTGKMRDVVAEFAALKPILRRQANKFPELKGLSWKELFKRPEQVFRYPDGTRPLKLNASFDQLLRDSDLMYDSEGNKRKPYSFRHYYITRQIENKTSLYIIAKNCGNSPRTIENNYDHLLTKTRAHEFTRVTPKSLLVRSKLDEIFSD